MTLRALGITTLLLATPSLALADFILTAKQRRIDFEVSQWAPPKKKKKDHLARAPRLIRMYLKFLDASGKPTSHEFGRAETDNHVFTHFVTDDQYDYLEKNYRGQVAQIVVEDTLDKLTLETQERIYVAGASPDTECRHPALVTDFHGTIDEAGDACARPALDRLHDAFPLTTFIVSTGGSAIKPEIGTLRFGARNPMIILDRVPQRANGPFEKSERVNQALSSAGICVVGFIGNTHEKDGAAARMLNLPYFSVNADKPKKSGKKRKEPDEAPAPYAPGSFEAPTWCELEPQLHDLLKSKGPVR